MLDDHEQKLFYKLLIEELKSYGFNEDGEQITPIKSKDEAYVRLLLLSHRRIVASVKREHKRKERISRTTARIEADRDTFKIEDKK